MSAETSDISNRGLPGDVVNTSAAQSQLGIAGSNTGNCHLNSNNLIVNTSALVGVSSYSKAIGVGHSNGRITDIIGRGNSGSRGIDFTSAAVMLLTVKFRVLPATASAGVKV